MQVTRICQTQQVVLPGFLKRKATRTRTAALALGACVGWGALRAWAGGGPCGYLVVYDPTDTNSLAVANYYQQVRHVPEANMIPYVFSPYYAAPSGMSLENTYLFITNLQNIVTSRGMTGHFNGIAMAGISPVLAGLKTIGSAQGYANSMLTALYQAPNYSTAEYINTGGLGNGAFREPPVQQTTEMRSDITFTNSSYSDTGLSGPIYTGRYWCVSYVGFTGAGANSPQDVFDYLQRAKAADGQGQGGVIYCPYPGSDNTYPADPNYNTRYHIRGGEWTSSGASPGSPIATAAAAWRTMGIAYAQPYGYGSMTQAGDIGGEVDGSYLITEAAPNGNSFLPGAWCDHATSSGGNIDSFYNGQSTCAHWLHAGAYGTFGCMWEPIALTYKFPHPHIHTHFRNGASLAEAFWQSMIWSMEGVVLGDPLLQPYASFPVVTISTPAADGATVSGSSVTIAASASTGAVNSNCTMAVSGLEANLDLAVDGHVVNIGTGGEAMGVTRNSGTSFTLDTTTLSDGYHELRVIAYNNNSVRTQGETNRTIFVNNHGQSVALSGATSVDYAGGSVALTVLPSGISGATNLTIQANGRTLGTLPVGGGTTNLPSSAFAYQGTTTVHAVAWLSNGKQVWSAPRNVAVAWTPLAPQPVTLATNFTAIVKYFASTTNGGFNWNTTPPTATIGYNNYLHFNTNTLSAVAPSDYTTAPGYEVNTYYWAANTNLYEFAFYSNDTYGKSYASNATMSVDGHLLGNLLPGNTVPVRLATGAHLLTLRFTVASNAFDQMVFVRDVNEDRYYLPFISNWGSTGEYVIPQLLSLFTATNATPPTITSGPSAASSLNSNQVNFSVTATTGNAGPMTYTWAKVAGPDQGTIIFAPNGTVGAANTVASFGNGQYGTEGKPGTYLVQVTVNDGTAVAIGQVQVTVSSSGKTIAITPATANLRINNTQNFQASFQDGFGNTLWPSPTNYVWSATAGSIVPLGRSNGFGDAVFAQYSSPTAGTNTITVSMSGASSVSALAYVVNNLPPVLGTPTCALAQANMLIHCVASATDDGGADVTYTWVQTSGPAPLAFRANNSAAAANSYATYLQTGVYGIQVIATDADGASTTSAVQTVTIAPIFSFAQAQPNPAVVQAGGTLQFSAKGYDQFGSEMDPSLLTNRWTLSDASAGAITTAGFFTASTTLGDYDVCDYINRRAYVVYSEVILTDLAVVATPTFNPVSGSYLHSTHVTLTTATAGAQIYYTTDGSLPSASNGTLYSSPISVCYGITELLARACKSGMADSSVVSANYNIPITNAPAPGGLTAVAVATNQIDLSWVNTGGGGIFYMIERATNASFSGKVTTQFMGTAFTSYSWMGVTSNSVCYYADRTGLSVNQSYCYRLRAGDNYGNSPVSSVAQATTTAPFGTPPHITSSLSAQAIFAQPFNYAITASNSPASFAAIGLPAGLSINTGSGVISGAPVAWVTNNVIPTNNVVILAFNASGFDSQTLVLVENFKDSVGDGIPDWWRMLYFGGNGTTTNSQSCTTADLDSDGFCNLQEYLAGANPTNFWSFPGIVWPFDEHFDRYSLSNVWQTLNGAWAVANGVWSQTSTNLTGGKLATLRNGDLPYPAGYTILVKMRVNGWTDGPSARAGISLNMDTAGTAGYSMVFTNHNTLAVQFAGASVDSFTCSWTNGIWYWFKLSADVWGDVMTEVWPEGSQEPTANWSYGDELAPVVAVLDSGTSGNQVSFDDVYVLPNAFDTSPIPASQLTAISEGTSQIKLSWLNNAAADLTYSTMVDRASNAGFTSNLTTVAVVAPATNYSDTGLARNSTYYYRLHVVNINGQSPYSAIVCATTSAGCDDPFTTWQGTYFTPSQLAEPSISGPNADPLGKGICNSNQYLVGLNPTNPLSVFQVAMLQATGVDIRVTWKAAGPRTNYVQVATNGLGCGSFHDASGPIFLSVTGDTTGTYTDIGAATNRSARFYRIRLGP